MTDRKNAKYAGVIFDLDGTLLDTLADLGDSVNAVLAEHGCPPRSYDEYKLIIGKGFRDLLTRSFPDGRSPAEIDAALAGFTAIYDRNYRRKTAPYPGIPEMLAALRDKRVELGVNSNKRDDYSNNLIAANFPDIPFVGVFGEREGVAKKPDPQSALQLASLMSLAPERILYVGDSKTDMQTGRNAGMGTGGVLWGFRDAEELRANGADHLFASAREITGLF